MPCALVFQTSQTHVYGFDETGRSPRRRNETNEFQFANLSYPGQGPLVLGLGNFDGRIAIGSR